MAFVICFRGGAADRLSPESLLRYLLISFAHHIYPRIFAPESAAVYRLATSSVMLQRIFIYIYLHMNQIWLPSAARNRLRPPLWQMMNDRWPRARTHTWWFGTPRRLALPGECNLRARRVCVVIIPFDFMPLRTWWRNQISAHEAYITYKYASASDVWSKSVRFLRDVFAEIISNAQSTD